jgi:hypothetical protein
MENFLELTKNSLVEHPSVEESVASKLATEAISALENNRGLIISTAVLGGFGAAASGARLIGRMFSSEAALSFTGELASSTSEAMIANTKCSDRSVSK